MRKPTQILVLTLVVLLFLGGSTQAKLLIETGCGGMPAPNPIPDIIAAIILGLFTFLLVALLTGLPIYIGRNKM